MTAKCFRCGSTNDLRPPADGLPLPGNQLCRACRIVYFKPAEGEDLAADRQVGIDIDEAVSGALASVLNNLPDRPSILRWTLDGDVICGEPFSDMHRGRQVAFLIRSWANRLHLDLDELPNPGTVSARGKVGGRETFISGVVDPVAAVGHQAGGEVRVPIDLVDDTVGECPGCVGRGTGETCVVCDRPIPDLWRRDATSPSEYRTDCADCRRGAQHTHGGIA